MDSLKRSMRWDETAFGLEYDLDIFNIVAVSDFNMGAMENKGLNVFNDKYVLADPETATDVDFAYVEGVIGHEYFHNWTGDRITCRDWFQLCLKEGLTVYRDQEFSSDMRSRAVKRIADVRALKARQFPEDAGPLAHPVRPEAYHEINNFYTPTVYDKGAEVVRMLKTVVGAEGFRAGMDLYVKRHDGQAVTIEDFLAAFADANNTDLAQFKLWYSQAGTPEVSARGAYDARARTYTLALEQSVPPTPGQSAKQPMHIPVRFGLVGQNGEDLAFDRATGGVVTGDVIHLTAPSQTIVFHGVSNRPVPSLLRGFSAPVRLSIDLSTADLLFLLRTDADPFNRWQAAQTLATRTLIAGAAAAAQGERVDFDPAFIDALADVAENDALEPAFRAQIMQLPGEADVGREIGRDVDPDAIATARNQVRARIADRVGARLAAVLDRLDDRGPFSPDAAAAGRRALAGALLDLMVADGNSDAIARVVDRFETADNMTDRAAALAILTGNALDERRRRPRRLPRALPGRSARSRQVAGVRGDRAGAGDPRPGSRASRGPGLRALQPEPHPRAGRRLRRRQPDPVQPRRRRRLRFPRALRDRPRPAQPADRGAAAGQLPLVAGAGTGPPGEGRGGAAHGLRSRRPFERHPRHRHPHARLTNGLILLQNRRVCVPPDSPATIMPGRYGQGDSRRFKCGDSDVASSDTSLAS